MKTPEAFRSISEVSAAIGVPQHTLRAWETRFSFVKPVKRADGRRYYRPSDLGMLSELKRLLTEDKLSTERILERHRAGGLVPTNVRQATPEIADRATIDLHHHLTALTAARVRLAAMLG